MTVTAGCTTPGWHLAFGMSTEQLRKIAPRLGVQQAFAVLNELQQTGVLNNIEYRTGGSGNGQWRARLSVASLQLRPGFWASEGRGGSKRDAKALAAERLLRTIVQGM